MNTIESVGRVARAFHRAIWLLSALCLTLVIGSLISPAAHGAGLLVADGGFGGVLEIEEHSAQVTIKNGIAVTQVTQVFRNTENRVVEALYTFPVPEGASVANFSMWINGKEMVGEVVEKERARQIYESYKQTRRDPGLLEQVDYKTFEMRIFPIAAGAEQRVEITYYQELDFDHDRATYVYPLATTTQEADSATRGRFALDLDVKSEVPIVKLESPSHGDEFVVVAHTEAYHQASLETTGGDLDRDLVLTYEVSRPFTGLDLLTSRVDGEDGFFQLTLTAGEELERTTTAWTTCSCSTCPGAWIATVSCRYRAARWARFSKGWVSTTGSRCWRSTSSSARSSESCARLSAPTSTLPMRRSTTCAHAAALCFVQRSISPTATRIRIDSSTWSSFPTA